MLPLRTAGKAAGMHRAGPAQRGTTMRVIDQRYEVVERRSTARSGASRWLAYDPRLQRRVLVELRPANRGTTPESALQAHAERVREGDGARVLDGGYWARRGGPVTYVVLPAPVRPESGTARRWSRNRVVQAA